MDKQAPRQAPNAKYGVTMSERLGLRMTAEQLRLVKDTFPPGAGSASEFWREYSLHSAEQLQKLQAGEITAVEFGSNVAQFVQNYLSATLPGQEPEPDE